jgi:putative membrane protein
MIFMLGVLVSAVAWLGPLPALARQSFAAHMAMHMAVVAVAAPLIALAASGHPIDRARARFGLFAPIPASIVELIVVWIWHAPALHHAARHVPWALVIEQGTFLLAGLLLWTAAVGGSPEQQRLRGGAGVVGLLFTSMHMTLLGALFALAGRPLYPHLVEQRIGLSPIADQQLGGAIMLFVGGASYLAGGLWLTAGLLRGSARNQRMAS